MWASIGFTRKRDYPPAEGTFDISARARVEPLGFAPTAVPSATFDVRAVARIEPVGEIPPIPNQPTNNSVSEQPSGTIVQTWDFDLGGLDQNTVTIRVQEATNVGFTVGLEEATGTPFLFGGLKGWPNHQDGVTRYYRVRAENGSGDSSWSAVVSIVHESEAPGQVENLNVVSANPTSLLATWDAPVSGGPVDHYEIETVEEGAAGTSTSESKVISGLESATAYLVLVRAVGPSGVDGPGRSDLGVTEFPAPGLEGCHEEVFEGGKLVEKQRLIITDNANGNESIQVEKNGNLYDTIDGFSQTYTPSATSGSWRVRATGGSVGHFTLGSGGEIDVPASRYSPTRTMPFGSECSPEA